MILCIDPGQKGAFCFYYNTDKYSFYDMVELYDIQRLKEIMSNEDTPRMIYIEKAQSMPKQGVSSMFSYGKHTGWLIGYLQSTGIPIEEVPPQRWCKIAHAGVTQYTGTGSGKKKSLEAVRKLFPNANLIKAGCRKLHDGYIDALLMSYAMERQNA